MLFPTSEPKIKRLCDQMLDGLFWHQPDFPHVHRLTLHSKRLLYTVTKKNHLQAKSQKRIATKVKNERLSELVKIMHNCLKKSEVDVSSNPEKLKLIGWSPKNKPQPAQIPAPPINLRVIAVENQTVHLEWQRPADDTRIRNYVIERRLQSGDWQPLTISYNTQINLSHQPQGIRLEYRVRASSSSGAGPEGNTVSVIL